MVILTKPKTVKFVVKFNPYFSEAELRALLQQLCPVTTYYSLAT